MPDRNIKFRLFAEKSPNSSTSTMTSWNTNLHCRKTSKETIQFTQAQLQALLHPQTAQYHLVQAHHHRTCSTAHLSQGQVLSSAAPCREKAIFNKCP